MRIARIELIHNPDPAMVCHYETKDGKDRLWFSVEPQYARYLVTERCDAFFVALLPMAMKMGEDIHLDVPVSERLYYNISQSYMRIFSLISGRKDVAIRPGQLDAGRSFAPGAAVVTGLSCGVDSFCVLADHLLGDVPPSFRLTHLAFNDVGSHGRGDRGHEMFQQRRAKVAQCAETLGLPLVTIRSNIDEKLPLGFRQTHSIRNIAAILSMQKLFSKYYYASGYPYQDSHIGRARDLACADPAAIHLLSTEGTQCISSGGQYRRTEKTRRITDCEITKRHLDVCVKEGSRNCSACWKCLRTLATLDVLGRLQEYSGVFDLGVYQRMKTLYLGEVLAGCRKDPLLRDIAQRARDVGFSYPVSSRLLGRLPYRLAKKLRELAGKKFTR